MTKKINQPIRIGILIRDFQTLDNYEFRIINDILSDPDLELALLIKDGRTDIQSFKNKVKRNIFTKSVFSNIIYKVQCFIEAKMFKPKPSAINRAEIIEQLNKIPCIQLKPTRKGFLDIFSTEESSQVKEYDLDLMLRHEFNIIRGEILESARHGIWSFHHGDNAVNRGGPAGFWEIVLNEPYVGVTLQRLTSTLDGGLIIDKAFYNWNSSHIVTSNSILESSVELLRKNINKLKYDKVKYTKSMVYYNRLYKKPGLKYLFIYLFKFYAKIVKTIFYRVAIFLSGKRKNCWYLYASRGVFLESQLFNKKEIAMPKNEFWADPFLIRHKNELYAFFENYEYKIGKGKISCAKIIDNKFTDVKDALCTSFHLSYPFIIKQGDDIFLIPETAQNRKVEIYRCIEFPDKWELYSTAFENEEIVDTTYFVDDNNEQWLFLNKGYVNKPELHIYKIDSLKLNKIEPHLMNPVKIDSRTARNAGAIFKYENDYYRPSQENAFGFYGSGLNINRIVKLDMEEYIEEKIITIKPNFKKGLIGLHHVHQIDDYFIFDVCQKLK